MNTLRGGGRVTDPPSLIEAFDDPKLFGIDLWPMQRRLLEDVERHRLNVWALGRRSSKTFLSSGVCVHGCLFRPDLDAMVRPGEARYSVAIATNHEQARLIVRAARSIIERSPLLAGMVKAATEDGITFTNGTELRAFPCTARGRRGWPISTLVMDEAAHFLSESDGYQTAARVWEAMAPSTAQFGLAARIIVSSTPYGSEGLFAKLHAQALEGELADAVAHRASTAEANPTVDAAFLAAERVRDPAAFRQEYEAEFGSTGDSYIDWDLVPAPAERGHLKPSDCKDWVIGLDPAFSRDNFGIAIVGRDHHDRRKLRVGRIEAYKPDRSFPGPLPEIARLARGYRARLVSDQYGAEPIQDWLRREGHAVKVHNMSAESKTAVFSTLRARLEDGSLELYDEPRLIAELKRLRTKFSAGSAAVVNPRVGGSHGDVAQALALAVYELRQGGSGRGRVRVGGRSHDYSPSALNPLNP